MAQATPQLLLLSIRAMSALLTVLLIWLFSFFLSDIDDIQGPLRADFDSKTLNAVVVSQELALKQTIASQDSAIERQGEIQERLATSMSNAEQTLRQVTDLQRFQRERGAPTSDEEQASLTRAQSRFMDAQDAFEEANATIATLEAQRWDSKSNLAQVQTQLGGERKKSHQAFQEAWDGHRTVLGVAKLGFIVPVLLLSAFLFRKHRKSLLRPILLAFLLSSFWKVGTVMHDHFPSEFFKYIAIFAALIIVTAFLVFLLKSSAKPDTNALLRRRGEGYQKGLCPECSFPFAGKGFGKVKTSRGGEDGMSVQMDYNCPSCGTGLFEKCNDCGGRRHSLLPHCVHCGKD
ncbi:MAG: hypothetical protein HOM34_07240 [Planctomycetes bacterium]|jgi:predicted RNA-binding Zn-ribbon protein involved in translation (DUF1610 family)|nr:hypothetical protein [Planctomycetota bacterium]MBT4028683.1 hypothetical protein [Planctomycetota bacterium]MBT4560103.1 hypothetical protein [Planctomycetota bacterium]MBT5102249.1 hypothetical protein [Planctomycetota bacterium]MBT5120497.1 hypothetical protein [Planctomycetota bacterium]